MSRPSTCCGSKRRSSANTRSAYQHHSAHRHTDFHTTVKPHSVDKKGSPYSITERSVLQLIPVLGSQPAGESHKPGGWLPLLSTRPAVTPATLKRAATNFAAWWTEAQWVWTVCLRLLHDCDLNPGPSVPESSTLTTRLPSHTHFHINVKPHSLPRNQQR